MCQVLFQMAGWPDRLRETSSVTEHQTEASARNNDDPHLNDAAGVCLLTQRHGRGANEKEASKTHAESIIYVKITPCALETKPDGNVRKC